ncbi:AAA domain-containing protein [Sulfitobacter dubius]|nr:AAA domain-containing protein [Sulfitobacter dubius]
MNDGTIHEARALHLLTTDSLLTDLVLGRRVAIAGGNTVNFESADTRNVLEWYRTNTDKWHRNLNAQDVEAIVDRISREIPESLASSLTDVPHLKRVLTLKRVVAHRFAGLHSFGLARTPPENFVFEIEQGVTLLEGANGSGKTSVANAIVWCLTGHLIRSQREPESGPTEFECEVKAQNGDLARHMMSAVTPMPHAGDDLPEQGKPIIADTWVELFFVDSEGIELPPLRREQSRTTRGRVVENPPDLKAVGLDPIAWQMATTMPALLPFLSVGSTSQLGHAVAKLTGLASLVDLSKHAQKTKDRISSRLIKELDDKCGELISKYGESVSDIERTATEHSDLELDFTVPIISSERAEDGLQRLQNYFEGVKAQAFNDAKAVLGAEFDPEDRSSRSELEKQIHPALAQLKAVRDLPSMSRVVKMMLVTDDEEALARRLLKQIMSEAGKLNALIADRPLASRAQLYARISDWLSLSQQSMEKNCPVCIQNIENRIDPVTGRPIIDHIGDAAADKEFISKSIAQWSENWAGRLSMELSGTLSSELRLKLPHKPVELMTRTFTVELFEADCFQGVLASLSRSVSELVKIESEKLTEYETQAKVDFPVLDNDQADELAALVSKLEKILSFVQWIKENRPSLREFQIAVVKGEETEGLENPAIEAKLNRLLVVVDGVAPLNSALQCVSRLKNCETNYRATIKKIALCQRAELACEELIPLGALAEAQVKELRTLLQDRAEYWRNAVYQNATTYAPELTGTELDAKGVLGLKVGRMGVEGPAQHLANASALRGSLLGFFLAFREHVLEVRGGLKLLVLDDPQDLLDNDNKIRLARGITRLAENLVQVLATTHDKNFARALVQENRSANRVRHLSVHPVHVDRPVLMLSPSIEEVDKKREAFRRNNDAHNLAQDYASDLRVFLEARIGDLFDGSLNPAYANPTQAPTLIPLLDKLKSLVSSGIGELATDPVVKRFAKHPAFESGAEARRILNQSHHDKQSIQYMDVKNVEDQFSDLRTSVEKVHQQFRFHKWREPLIEAPIVDDPLVELPSMVKPDFNVPICPDLAAFTADILGEGSQEILDEYQSSDWFDGKSLFFIRGESLGFSIPSGAIAIVNSQPYAGGDQNLVISTLGEKVFARRMLKPRDATGVSLTAEIPDPRNRRTTLLFDQGKLKIYKIVGVIFANIPTPPGGHEATQIDNAPELRNVELAYRVREESAVPLVLPGQVVLGGPRILPDELDRFIGSLVALSLSDGRNVLKRIGTKLGGASSHLRQFETIGGLGASIVVATAPTQIGRDFPVILSARRVLCVLYDMT